MKITEVNLDLNEKKQDQLNKAKLTPYDGNTVYNEIDDGNVHLKFMGHSVEPFKVLHPTKSYYRVGTQITAHYETSYSGEDNFIPMTLKLTDKDWIELKREEAEIRLERILKELAGEVT